MTNFVYALVATLGTMSVLDGLWLGLVARKFYKTHLGYIMTDKPNWFAAGLFYLIFVVGVTVFIVYPGWKNGEGLLKIALLGALFGLTAYATYDLTNQATLKNWPVIVTVVDLAWGTIIGASVSALSVLLLKTFVK